MTRRVAIGRCYGEADLLVCLARGEPSFPSWIAEKT
jgi:hypothetical protein